MNMKRNMEALMENYQKYFHSHGEYDLRMEIMDRDIILSHIIQFFDKEGLWDKYNEFENEFGKE